MRKIVFTGGGSSGHVILNLNLIKYFQKEGWEIYYLGSFEGIENELLKDYPYVHYIGIPTGKLRRYYSLENFKDLFRILSGIKRAYTELRKIRPELIFSKGGFVSVPGIVAGKLLNIKSYIHESDITVGLANKIAYHFCDRMFTTFPLEGLKKSKRVGSVINSSVICADLPFIDNKPVLLVTGGSLGAQTLNDFVKKNKNRLLEKFNIIHISGDKKAKIKTTNYWNIDYTKEGLTPFIKSADLVISRAGSNSIFEILNEKN